MSPAEQSRADHRYRPGWRFVAIWAVLSLATAYVLLQVVAAAPEIPADATLVGPPLSFVTVAAMVWLVALLGVVTAVLAREEVTGTGGGRA